MTIGYEQARDIARDSTEPNWPDESGTYCLDDRRIIENDRYYVFRIGAREFLVDGDFSYSIMGGVPVVYKEDGRFDWLPSPDIGHDKTLRSMENPNPTLEI